VPEIEKLIITGSNGFVGESLLDFIAQMSQSERPKRIFLVNRSDRSAEVFKKFPNLNIEYLISDLADEWKFQIPNAHLINLAADGGIGAYNQASSDLFESIGRKMCEWIVRNKPINSFHASSGACFGIKYLPINSEVGADISRINLKDEFMQSRLKVENQILSLVNRNDVSVRIGRLFSFGGKNLLKKQQYAFSSFVNGAVNDGKVVVTGNPNTIRSFLHESEMSSWILKSLTNRSKNVLSIGSGLSVSIGELAEFVANETGAEVEYLGLGTLGDVYVAENSATLTELEVIEEINWRETVRECVQIAKEMKNYKAF